jgi:hypothetical protein
MTKTKEMTNGDKRYIDLTDTEASQVWDAIEKEEEEEFRNDR